MKLLLKLILTSLISTTLVFAYHTEENEFDQLERMLDDMPQSLSVDSSQTEEAKEVIISELDRLIVSEQKSTLDSDKKIKRFERKLSRDLKRQHRTAKKLLSNEKRLKRVEAKLVKKMGSQFDVKSFRQSLIESADLANLKAKQEQIMNQIIKLGSLENYYQSLKHSVSSSDKDSNFLQVLNTILIVLVVGSVVGVPLFVLYMVMGPLIFSIFMVVGLVALAIWIIPNLGYPHG